MNGLIIFAVFLLISNIHSYVYDIEPEDVEAVMDTPPSAVLYYMEGDQLSEKILANFREASKNLTKYGVLFGSFNCLKDPEKCKGADIRNLPDIRLQMFKFHFFKYLNINFHCLLFIIYTNNNNTIIINI